MKLAREAPLGIDLDSPETDRSSTTLCHVDEVVPRKEATIGVMETPVAAYYLLRFNLSSCPDFQIARSRFGMELTDLAVLTNCNG